MPTSPLTRDESQERTRRLLVEAALKLFERDGYRATSLVGVAAEAGFSKGAVYSNFASKERLFLATIEEEYGQQLSSLHAALAAGGDMTERLATLGTWFADNVMGHPNRARAMAEFALVTDGDEEVRARLAELRALLITVVEGLLAEQQLELGITFRLPPRDLAEVIVALVDGLVIGEAMAPAPASRFADAIALLLLPA
ncbi:MAG TPA: TetR/AcrR family transcriptional regulator [Mycobacteriales bacterium]